MRLIDADKLLEELIAYRNHTYQTSVYWAIDDAVDRVKEQPTAYDVEKLVSDAYKEGWSDALDWYGIKSKLAKRGRVDDV